MRFPDTLIMTRLFKLFGSQQLNPTGNDFLRLIKPYYFKAVLNNGYLLYNNKRARMNAIPTGDAFDAKSVGVTDPYIAAGVEPIVSDVIHPFAVRLEEDLKTGGKEGWRYMQQYDQYSARAYMSVTYKPSPSLNIPSAPLPVRFR